MLIRELTDLDGISGFEEPVRDFIKGRIEKYVDLVSIDTLGNLIAHKKGSDGAYRIMLSAHMDEVGFMVTGINENGTLRFKPVGGLDERILPGQRVLVGEKKINGVIGAKPIHLQTREERNSNIKLKNMSIDIGCEKKDEAEKNVSIGDPVSFYSEFVEFGDGLVKAKALDDRVGCAVLMEIAKKSFPFDLYLCFTVQEEVGLRGSEVAANAVKPHVGIVVEGTTCSDVSGVLPSDHSTALRGGAALTVMDRTAYADKALFSIVNETAQDMGIKVQYKKTTTGGNDAGKIQRSSQGVKVVSISVPCRYIHSPVSVMSRNDFDAVNSLVLAVLESLGKSDSALLKKLCEGTNNYV